mmetsp:Transcript_73347/g.90032  ORF Transcript_73347/g.90032 Transcript_73347/m.90032 type:complete len:207 (+) Transcript_73347:733-1353(+)
MHLGFIEVATFQSKVTAPTVSDPSSILRRGFVHKGVLRLRIHGALGQLVIRTQARCPNESVPCALHFHFVPSLDILSHFSLIHLQGTEQDIVEVVLRSFQEWSIGRLHGLLIGHVNARQCHHPHGGFQVALGGWGSFLVLLRIRLLNFAGQARPQDLSTSGILCKGHDGQQGVRDETAIDLGCSLGIDGPLHLTTTDEQEAAVAQE